MINVDQQYINDTADWHRENSSTDFMWQRLRQARNMLLAETDVYAISDRTMSDEMKTYRQSLRDLPANTTDVYKPVYPTQPSS